MILLEHILRHIWDLTPRAFVIYSFIFTYFFICLFIYLFHFLNLGFLSIQVLIASCFFFFFFGLSMCFAVLRASHL